MTTTKEVSIDEIVEGVILAKQRRAIKLTHERTVMPRYKRARYLQEVFATEPEVSEHWK